ncbi:MAG TPA: YIP1 family protein [Bacteroidales bacterium]|nr:YIP1 family protein [Bacteroidales bacterium]
MDFSLLYNRIRLIFSNPTRVWEQVREEDRPIREVRTRFLLPLLILITLSSFAGTLIFTHSGLSILYPVIMAIKDFGTFFITVELAALVVTEISIIFTPEKDLSINYKLITYSATPYLVSMIVSRLVSSLIFLNIIGLYGFVILWIGINQLEPVGRRFKTRYFPLVLSATVILYLVIGWILMSVLDGLYFTIFR